MSCPRAVSKSDALVSPSEIGTARIALLMRVAERNESDHQFATIWIKVRGICVLANFPPVFHIANAYLRIAVAYRQLPQSFQRRRQARSRQTGEALFDAFLDVSNFQSPIFLYFLVIIN